MPGLPRLESKVAMITGAGSGIGAATALLFAGEGAAVMCVDQHEAAAQSTAARIAEHGGRAAALRVDVTDEAAVRAALEETVRELGGLHVLYNNAGVGGGFTWEQTIDVNLSGVYHGLKHGAPLMAERGGGSIVSTSSIMGLVASVLGAPPEAGIPEEAPVAAYVAAKHGVVGLTRQFAVSYGPHGVRVNCVNPGFVATPMTQQLTENEEARAMISALHPLGRFAQPEEIAAAVLFLASDEASFVSGHALAVDGGYTAR